LKILVYVAETSDKDFYTFVLSVSVAAKHVYVALLSERILQLERVQKSKSVKIRASPILNRNIFIFTTTV